jgi:hypothetical protein
MSEPITTPVLVIGVEWVLNANVVVWCGVVW